MADRQRWRSLRVRALFVVIIVALSPIIVLVPSTAYERSLGGAMRDRLARAVIETRQALLDRAVANWTHLEIERRVAAVSAAWGARIRVATTGGELLFDVDREMTATRWLYELLYGAVDIRALDDALGPIAARDEVRRATAHSPDTDCRPAGEGHALVCYAVVRVRADAADYVIHAQTISPRGAIRALHERRRELVLLSLSVLPAALFLGWWLGWRMVRPIERLRDQVLDKIARAAPDADIELDRGDEFGELALAFNSLLSRLETRTRQHEQFVAEVAHELKNPVAAIRACSEALDTKEVDEKRTERLAKVLRDSSARLDALLDQLLELARAEAGMKDEHREMIDLGQLVTGLVDTFSSDERFAGVCFTAEIPPDAVMFCGVPHALETALRNLLENAASFAGANGCVKASLWVEGENVQIAVHDTGPGIMPAHLPRVFDRFFTTRGARRGTGLGLALVKAVTEAHGGTVAVRSEAGQGASFFLRLPAHTEGIA